MNKTILSIIGNYLIFFHRGFRVSQTLLREAQYRRYTERELWKRRRQVDSLPQTVSLRMLDSVVLKLTCLAWKIKEQNFPLYYRHLCFPQKVLLKSWDPQIASKITWDTVWWKLREQRSIFTLTQSTFKIHIIFTSIRVWMVTHFLIWYVHIFQVPNGL